MNANNISSAALPPKSARSQKVIERIAPLLEKELINKNLKFGSQVFIRILKEEHILEVWIFDGDKYVLFKDYKIAYYSGGLGTKKKEGDGKSPEGFYTIYPYSLNPSSAFHLSFNIGYPNEYEKYRKYTGGDIMVHGNNVSIGCYAMTDPQIEEIYTIVHKAFENGVKSIQVHIFPFAMTKENTKKYAKNKNIEFWRELQAGFDYFENTKIVPKIKAIKGKYEIAG
jgi:murein L,D-transpeptidase YafK